MFLAKIRDFRMDTVTFFDLLSKGDIRCLRRSRVFFNRYYTDAHNERQSYDLVIPRSASGSTGLILCIHGGGWFEGSKSAYTDALIQVSEEKGFAAASVNYRYVSESVGFADILDDVTSALAAIKAKGSEYGVRFDKALLTGISAGGHISLMYAYTRRNEAPVRPVCVVELCGPTDLEHPFYYSEENSISKAVGVDYFRGVISRGVGYTIDPEDFDAARPALRAYSPIRFVGRNTVPTVFGHGEQDEIVPYQNALDLDAKLTQCGVEHAFISFPNSGHGCEDPTAMSKIMSLFFAYADKYLK